MKQIALLFTLIYFYCSASTQTIHVQENFDLGSLPSGWTNNAVSGSTPWQFGLNGSTGSTGNNNINGTAMAYFDDDVLGSAATNNTVELLTPIFDNSTDSITLLEFDYNFRQFGAPSDYFKVSVNDGTSWITVLTETTNNCGNYIGTCAGNFPKALIDISAYKNSNCQVKFTYHDGNDWCWYVGLDNVRIFSSVANDLEVTEIISPVSACNLDSNFVTIAVVNYDHRPTNQPIQFSLSLNNNQILTDTSSLVINPFDTLLYTFSKKVNFNGSATHVLVATVNYPNDTNTSNNSTSSTITNTPSKNLPYFFNFETTNTDWYTAGHNSSWAYGVPNGNILDTAFSGTKVYATNLNGRYNNSETSFLYSPCFDLSGDTTAPLLTFQINYIIESGFDSLVVQYQSDLNGNWKTIPYNGNINDWYNTISGFDGNSNGWQKKSDTLEGLKYANNAQIRFKLSTDGSGTFEGIMLDDFNIFKPLSTSINKVDPIERNISIYPNPGNGYFNLKVEHQFIGKTYQIFDMKGALLKEDRIEAEHERLNLEGVKQGVYFLKIDGDILSKKIVVF